MKFKTIHSLGSRCQTSDVLKHFGYREFSGFFDFMNTQLVWNINHILEDDFQEILKDKNNFSLVCNQLTIEPETGNKLPTSVRTSNSFYDVDHTDVHNAIFPHHDLNSEKDKNHFLQCKNRFHKLKNYNTLFVYSYNTWENNISQDDMEQMVGILRYVHGFKNFKICFIGITQNTTQSYKNNSVSDYYDSWSLNISYGSYTGGIYLNPIDNQNFINIIESYDIDDNRITKEEIDYEF